MYSTRPRVCKKCNALVIGPCKACISTYNKQRYQEKKQQIAEYKQKWYQKNLERERKKRREYAQERAEEHEALITVTEMRKQA